MIECIIEKERYIYDRDMPHLSYEIDEVKIGDILNAMIVETVVSKDKKCSIYCTL